MATGEQRLLAPNEVASLCGLSRKAVYRAIERGELRASRLCSRLRIRPDDVDRWIEAAQVEPAAASEPRPVRASAPNGLRPLLREPGSGVPA
jgi:excisionase family DNA binding protein